MTHKDAVVAWNEGHRHGDGYALAQQYCSIDEALLLNGLQAQECDWIDPIIVISADRIIAIRYHLSTPWAVDITDYIG
jgi:hypothetical protein